MKDMMTTKNMRAAIIPQTQTNSDSAIVGAIIDREGYESLTFGLVTGTVTDANVTTVLLVEHGDDSGLSDAAAVPDDQLVGTELLAAVAYTDDSVCKKIGYVGTKRYVRLTLTPTGNNSGALPIAAIAILENGHVSRQANPPA